MPDLSTLSDEELIKHLPDDVLMGIIRKRQGGQYSQPQKEGLSFSRGARQFGTGLAGGFTGSLTDIAANKAGIPESTLRNVGGLVGFLIGPGKLARGAGTIAERAGVRYLPRVSERLASSTFGRALQRGAIGAVEGGVGFGATGFGEAAEGRPEAILQRGASGAAVGAPIGVLAPMVPALGRGIKAFGRGIGSIGKTTSKGFPGFGQEVRTAYRQVGETLRTQFDPAMKQLEASNPGAKVNMRNVIERVRTLTNPESESFNPSLARHLDSAIRRAFPKGDVTLANLIENPHLADNATLTQSEQFIASLKAVPSLPGKLSRQGASFSDADLDLLDLANEARAAQLKAFPEFKGELEKYHEVNDALRKIKKFFTEGNLEKSVKGGFGSSEQEAMVRSQLPPDIYRAIKDVRMAENIKKGGLAIGGALLARKLLAPVVEQTTRK